MININITFITMQYMNKNMAKYQKCLCDYYYNRVTHFQINCYHQLIH